MHINIAREILLDRLELVAKVSTKHITLPVLQCVLFEVTNDVVTLRATNLEIGIDVTLPGAKIIEAGSIAIPAQILTQTIQYLTTKEVTLRDEEGVLIIEGVHSETSIKSIPADEFPTIPKLTGISQVIQRINFTLGIKTAAFAASVSSIKPELGSIYIHQKKEHSLTFVATDSFRLMEKTVPQKGVILDAAILIPQKNALEIARICETRSSDPELRVNENQCSLTFPDGVYITSRLISGSFPDYNQIIPKEYSTHVTALRSDLTQAFKKSSIFLNKFQQVSLTTTNGSLTVSAQSGEVGTTTESIRATTEGEDLTLSFNQRYLQEPLSHILDDSVILHFAGIGRPLVIVGVNDQSLRYLVMPMNK